VFDHRCTRKVQLDIRKLTITNISLAVFFSKESEALDHVFGYTVAHDVSARDWQLRKNNGQWGLGKSFETFCPLGPSIVHKNSLSGMQI
jgi:2-keto-4-pentenoate hydratase/2-oxohepta-3-ene-1,7-dioic acid hydratase in catechol pathway